MAQEYPSNSALEQRKLLLEVDLLELQKHEQLRRWFQRPVILFAILPSIVAAATLSFQLYTGYYENSARLATLEKKEAEQAKKQLDIKRNELKTIENDVAARQKKITKDQDAINAIRNEMAVQEADLQAELEAIEKIKASLAEAEDSISQKEKDVLEKTKALDEELALIDKQKQVAQAEIALLKKELATITQQFETAKSNLRYASIDAYIEAIAEGDSTPHNESAKALIRYLQNTDAFTFKDIDTYFNKFKSEPLLYINLLHALYRAFEEPHLVNRIMDFAELNLDNTSVWWFLGTADWFSSDEVSAWKRYLELARTHKPSNERLSAMYLKFGYPSAELDGKVRTQLKDDNLYFYSVKTAYGLAMDEQAEDHERGNAVLALKGLAPSLALVVMAKLYESKTSSETLKFEVYQYLSEAAEAIMFDIEIEEFDPLTNTFGDAPTSEALSRVMITYSFPYNDLYNTGKWDNNIRAKILTEHGI